MSSVRIDVVPLRRTTLAFLAGVGLLLGPFSQHAGAPGLSAPTSMRRAALIRPSGTAARELPPWRGGRLDAVSREPTLLVYARPGAASDAPIRVSSRNPWGQAIRFLVVGVERDASGHRWLRVLLGTGPNGASGWVPLSEVHLRVRHDRIVVSLSRRMLWHLRDGRLVQRFSVGVGAASTPTTPGRFFVWAKLPSAPHGPYGVYVLGLSGFSRVLTNWPGGGRMAIHGTDDPYDRGQWVSHGCVRVFNPQMEQLRDVPLGTQVLIRD
jgi:hypothetical protein